MFSVVNSTSKLRGRKKRVDVLFHEGGDSKKKGRAGLPARAMGFDVCFFFARGRTRRQIPRDPNTWANHGTKCIHFDMIQFDLMKGSLRRGFQPPPRSAETAIIIPLFRARARVRVWQDGTRRGALRGRRRCWGRGVKARNVAHFGPANARGAPPGKKENKEKKMLHACASARVDLWAGAGAGGAPHSEPGAPTP